MNLNNFFIALFVAVVLLWLVDRFVLHWSLADFKKFFADELAMLRNKIDDASTSNNAIAGTSITAVASPPAAPVVVNVHTIPPASSPVAPSALPAGIDTPDASGRVKLTGIPAGNVHGDIRFAIDEVGLALPMGSAARADCLANVDQASNAYNVENGFIGVCYPLVTRLNKITGAPEYSVDAKSPIHGTLALPVNFTVASATAFYSALPNPTQGDGQFVPRQK